MRCAFGRGALWLAVVLALALPVLTVAVPQVAYAQTAASTPDYEAWASVAARAEDAIAAGRASDDAFGRLREELVGWREQFAAGQNVNADRIQTVQAQIEALGPAPSEDESEPTDVAQRRSELNVQLAELRAPNRQAVEAFSRAEGLIREIDTLLRDRQAEAIMERAPMPINPGNWPRFMHHIVGSASGIAVEVSNNWSRQSARMARQDDLPLTLALLFVAVVLLWRGRMWVERLVNLVFSRSGSEFAGLLISTGKILIPFGGIFVLVASLNSLNLFGPRGQALINALPFFVLCTYSALWVSDRVFPKTRNALILGEIDLSERASLRRYAVFMGIAYGLHGIAASLASRENYDEGTQALLYLPFLVIAGFSLVRFGQHILRYSRRVEEADNVGLFQVTVIGFVARGAVAMGVIGPVAALLGYTNAALSLVYPAAQTLALFGLVVILNRVIFDIYSLITRKTDEEAQQSLIPTLVVFVLTLAVLPVLAVIWGARVTELQELWVTFREGFAIGDTTISPGDFLTVLIVFIIGYTLTRLIQRALKASVLPKTSMDAGGRNAVTSGVGYLGIFLSAVIAITLGGIDLSSLAIVAGALSVGIGFGLQNIVSNFVSGIILLVERPIGEGDWIEVGGTMGIVKKISVRSTTIETFDRTNVVVPNADFVSAPVTNWTRGNQAGRLIVKVGVAYGTDTGRVDGILAEIANDHPLVVVEPPPMILFAGFGADSLDFEIRMILRDVNFILNVQNDINHAIARRFAEEGIEIPFQQRDLWLRNPEMLRGEDKTDRSPSTATDEPALDRDMKTHMSGGDMDVDSDGADTDGGDGR